MWEYTREQQQEGESEYRRAGIQREYTIGARCLWQWCTPAGTTASRGTAGPASRRMYDADKSAASRSSSAAAVVASVAVGSV